MISFPYILIVDDDEPMRRNIMSALQLGTISVRIAEASAAASALDIVLAGPSPDLILLDLHLSDCSSFLKNLKEKIPKIPVVLLADDLDENLTGGSSDFLLRREISPVNLQRLLRTTLRLRKADEDLVQERLLRDADLRQNDERLRFLYLTTSSPDLDFDQKMDLLLEEGCRQFGMETGQLARVDTERFQVIRSYPPEESLPIGYTCSIDDTFCHEALRYTEAFSIQHTAQSEWQTHKAYLTFHREAYLGAIVWSHGHKIGTLAFTSSKPSAAPFSPSDKEYIRLMAQWIGGELHRLKAEEDLRHSEKRYRSLVDAAAQIVWAASAQGEFNREQLSWSAFTGQSTEELLGWGWLTAVHPEDQWDTVQKWSDAVAASAACQMEHRLRRHDGVYRTFLVRAVPVREEDGAMREWVGVHTDISERKEAERRLELLAEASKHLAFSLDYEQNLLNVARSLVPALADSCFVDVVTPDGSIRRIAAAYHAPRSMENIEGSIQNIVVHVVETGAAEMASEVTEAAQSTAAGKYSYLCVPLLERGGTLGAITLIAAESQRSFGQDDLEFAQELARRAAVAIDNARLYQETSLRAEREALVNRIGRLLRGSLDPHEVLMIATQELGVTLQADRCALATLSDARDEFEVLSPQYTSSGVPVLVANLPLVSFPSSYLNRWMSGETIAVNDIQEDPQAAFVKEILPAPVTLRAFLSSPIFLRGQWAGLLAVHQANSPREWTRDEAALLEAVTDILALALENARLYAREHHVADKLQAAFLPDIPEQIGGVELAISYSSGLEEAQVGGDLYDAFPLADGRVALVIADVSGKGLEAAVQTATVKYTLRAFAMEAPAPELVIRRLNRTLQSEASGLGEHFVTLFYGVLEPQSGRLAYVSAGHETQFIKRVAGGVTSLDATGPILGVTEHRYQQKVDYLCPGDSLILFTDGLTEARAAGTRELQNLDRIEAAVARLDQQCGPGALVAFLEKLTKDWTGSKPHDDLALLVARRALPAFHVSDADVVFDNKDSEEPLFGFSLPSSPEFAAEVRQTVAHWMELLGYSQEQTEDFQTAVTEAVTNAVRHGSPLGAADTFRVWGYRHGEGSFIVEVSDHGPGLPVQDGLPPMPVPEALGGRGLPLIYSFADQVSILPASKGLCLRLVKTSPAYPAEGGIKAVQ